MRILFNSDSSLHKTARVLFRMLVQPESTAEHSHINTSNLPPSSCKIYPLLCVLYNTESTTSADWKGWEGFGLRTWVLCNDSVLINGWHGIVCMTMSICSEKKKDRPRASSKWLSWYDRIFPLSSARNWGRKISRYGYARLEKKSQWGSMEANDNQHVHPSTRPPRGAIITIPYPLFDQHNQWREW